MDKEILNESVQTFVKQCDALQTTSTKALQLQKNIASITFDQELSVYCMDAPATLDEVKEEAKRLIAVYAYKNQRTDKVYSKQSDEFWLELCNIIMENGWSKRQLHDAITKHISTCEYQTFTIANILSFNPKVKFYTHNQVYQMCGQYPDPNYVMVVTSVDHIITHVTLADYNKYRYTDNELDMMSKSGVVHRFGFIKFDKNKHKKYLKN